jgi:hypothetical protein
MLIQMNYLALLSCTIGLGVAMLQPMTANADVRPMEVQEYRQDFAVSAEKAEANLAIQQRGSSIVGELKVALGKNYAGVWFDNDAGQFVVPLLSKADHKLVDQRLVADGLQGNYRITLADSSWTELETAQTDLDRKLLPHIEDGFIETLLDPRANAVVIREAEGANKVQEAEIQRSALASSAKTEVQQKSLLRFDAELRACGSYSSSRNCDRPLRGGVAIEPDSKKEGYGYSGLCTAGFKATGNVTGNRYILTAGHCAAKVSNWASRIPSGSEKPIGQVEQYTFPGGDWAKIKANGSYWDTSPWPSMVAHYWEDQERTITAESYSYLGEFVCHSGDNSGTSCGNVSALNLTAGSGATAIYHETEFGEDCGVGGDSGGPVFAGHTAIGIYNGGNSTGKECPPGSGLHNGERGLYVEITEATTALGVSVGPRVGGAPYVVTNPVSGIQELEATFNGTVNPEGSPTSYVFQYGTTTAYGSSTASVGLGAGEQAISVSATVPNLHAGTTYHYRVVAFNALGTTYGADQQFTTSSAPAAVNTGSAINVYLRAADGSLYQKACCFGSEGWTNWWHMGSPYGEGITSGPAAVMQSSVLNVYARGSEGERSLYQISCCFGSEGWTSWWHMGSPYGGGVSTSPAAVMQYSTLNVYAGGGNDHLYQIACCFGSEGWTSWWDMGSPPGGGITSSPAAVNAGGGVINVYARGANGHLYQKACCFGSEGWTSWWDMGSPPGGGITSGPAAVNTGSAINVYARGANGHLYQKACCFGSEGWTSWWDMGSP